MATPIGHSLIAGLVYMNRTGARGLDLPVVLLFVLFANAPDLDFLPGILVGDPGAYHHGISHSLGIGLMFAVVVSLVATKASSRFTQLKLPALIAVGFVLYASHLLVDLVTLDNSVPFGMPLFWPISGAYVQMPLFVFPNVLHSGSQLSLHNAGLVLREILVFGPPLLYMTMLSRGWFRSGRRVGAVLAVGGAGALMALFVTVNPYF